MHLVKHKRTQIILSANSYMYLVSGDIPPDTLQPDEMPLDYILWQMFIYTTQTI